MEEQDTFVFEMESKQLWNDEDNRDIDDYYDEEEPFSRRDSTFEKALEKDSREEYIKSAKCRVYIVFLAALILVVYGFPMRVSELVGEALKQTKLFQHAKPSSFPSINLLDYEFHISFPVFISRPQGIPRKEMPQLPDRNNSFWSDFADTLAVRGGELAQTEVDLRFTAPLQSELSGFIVYNVLFETIREKLEENPQFLSEHIILIETPEDLVGRFGETIPKGTLLNFDGHHTNQVVKLCAKLQHPNLRRGVLAGKEHVCGHGFQTVQTVTVIRGLHPQETIALALEAGAESGHGMTLA